MESFSFFYFETVLISRAHSQTHTHTHSNEVERVERLNETLQCKSEKFSLEKSTKKHKACDHYAITECATLYGAMVGQA